MHRELSSQQKESLIRYITSCYRKSCQRQRMKLHGKEGSDPADTLTVSLYESALEALPGKYREIIVREFLDEEGEGWYYHYYSKSTFYRLRQRAISEFMDCMNV